ncbi:MAG: hypothetical protein LBJ10_06505, partial [Clostridiales bacterium]|nr:hypothetical protein [Clostridiales bacterium]
MRMAYLSDLKIQLERLKNDCAAKAFFKILDYGIWKDLDARFRCGQPAASYCDLPRKALQLAYRG